MKKILLATVLIISIPSLSEARFIGCQEYCIPETVTYPVSRPEVIPVYHRYQLTEERKVERTVRVKPVRGEHTCLDYRTWDEIYNDIDSGEDIGYYKKGNKLFSSDGKRFLRCNDPDNPHNFKKILEISQIPITKEWTEFVTVNKTDFLSKNVYNCSQVCYPNCVGGYSSYGRGSENGGGYGSNNGNGSENGNGNGWGAGKDPDPVSPVPEPGTSLLFGFGLMTLSWTYRYKHRKNRG